MGGVKVSASANQWACDAWRQNKMAAGCPEEENVFTEHLENVRRANSSKCPIDILYGRYAPIIIHDLQNAATHQKKVISDQSLKCKYLKTYVLPHFRSIAQHNLFCVKGSGRYIS